MIGVKNVSKGPGVSIYRRNQVWPSSETLMSGLDLQETVSVGVQSNFWSIQGGSQVKCPVFDLITDLVLRKQPNNENKMKIQQFYH